MSDLSDSRASDTVGSTQAWSHGLMPYVLTQAIAQKDSSLGFNALLQLLKFLPFEQKTLPSVFIL